MYLYYFIYICFPGGASGKEPVCQCRRHKKCRFNPWVEKIPWRKAWQPTPVFFPGESHEQRSPMGYGPQGHKETQLKQLTTQCMHTHTHTHTHTNPQCMWIT